MKSIRSVTSIFSKYKLPILVFGLFTVFEIILGQVLNTTWEWDALTRSKQGYEIATKGVSWYFFDGSGHNVWLPFWQLLIGFEYSLLHIDTMLIGEITSALCAGGTAVYIYFFLKKFGADESQSILGSLMLLTFGHYIAYSSQAMTESLSVFFLVVCFYHLYQYFDTSSIRSLGLASGVSLLNVATRYEAWFFLVIIVGFILSSLVLSKNPSFKFVKATHIVLFVLPSIVFIGLWLEYNLAMTGNIFAFKDWIFANNAHENFVFYKDIGYTLILVLGNLFFTLGSFWMSIPLQIKQLTNRNRRVEDDVLILFGLTFLGYIAYVAYSMFTGFNNGWSRQLLYFVPSSIITFTFRKFEKTTSYVLFAFNLVLGMVAFAYNIQAHNIYVQSGQ